MDHYEALDADPTETEADLRRRYLKAARQYHPDQLTQASQAERDVAEDKMRAVNQAWNVLGDKGRRLQYDQSLFEEQHFQAQAEWKPYDDSPVAEYEEPMVPGRARPPLLDDCRAAHIGWFWHFHGGYWGDDRGATARNRHRHDSCWSPVVRARTVCGNGYERAKRKAALNLASHLPR